MDNKEKQNIPQIVNLCETCEFGLYGSPYSCPPVEEYTIEVNGVIIKPSCAESCDYYIERN